MSILRFLRPKDQSMQWLKRSCLVVVLILLPALAARLVAGGEAKVKLTILVILAKEDGDFIDPKLKGFAKEVQVKSPAFKSFRIKTMIKDSMAAHEKKVF